MKRSTLPIVSCLLFLFGCDARSFEQVSSSRAALSSTVGWSYGADGGIYTNQDQLDGSAVGLHLVSRSPSDGVVLGELTRDQVDLRTPDGGAGPGVVGLLIGNRGSADNPVWVGPGSTTLEALSGVSRYMPVVVKTPYVYWDGRTSHTGGSFAAVNLPHSGIGSDGPMALSWVSTLWTDGAPDINPDLSVDTSLPGEGSYAIRANGDAVYFGGSLVWGQPENGTSNYEDCATGSSAPTAGAGHVRRACDTTTGTMGYNISVDGDTHWQPLPVAMQGFFNWGTGYGQSTTSFAAGETVMHTWVPNDARGAGDHGLRSWSPRRWNLPAQQSVTGGVVKVCLRFMTSVGSSQLLCNTTGGAVATNRGDVFLALVGAWITEIRAVAVNTSSMTSPPIDVGLIQYEGEAL